MRIVSDQEIHTDLSGALVIEMDNVLHKNFDVYLDLVFMVIYHLIQEINTDVSNALDHEIDKVLHNAFALYLELILTVISHVIRIIIQHLFLADPVHY